MKVNVVINDPPVHKDLIKPIKCFGAEEGKVFQMYEDGAPSNDTFLIGTGRSDRPICVWYNEEDDRYGLSSESKKDLKAFSPHIRFKEIDAVITFDMTVN